MRPVIHLIVLALVTRFQNNYHLILGIFNFHSRYFTCMLHHGKPGPRPEGVVVTEHIWQPCLHSKLPKPIVLVTFQYKINL